MSISRGGATFRRAVIVALAGLGIVLLGEEILVGQADSAADLPGDLQQLWARWQNTPADSAEESAAADALQQWVEQNLGETAVIAYVDYLQAPRESQEEQDALDEAKEGAEAAGVPWELAEQMCTAYVAVDSNLRNQLQGSASASLLPDDQEGYAAEIGGPDPLKVAPVDLELITTREVPVAGEIWTVQGELHNRSDHPVWIVNARTSLNIPPEVWGITSQGGSIGAFFPSVKSRPTNEIVRIEPGQKYNVIWKVDSWASHLRDSAALRRGGRGWREVMSRIHVALLDFLFFEPGSYIISANIHVWPAPPRVSHGIVTNTGDSFTLSADKQLYVEASQWVLVFGATIGGLACFFLLLIFRLRRSALRDIGGARYLIFGAALAVLLCGIGTVLLSRLSTTDFLVSVKVKDFWGAVATGFVIQWLGLKYFIDNLGPLSPAIEEERLEIAYRSQSVEPAAASDGVQVAAQVVRLEGDAASRQSEEAALVEPHGGSDPKSR